MEFTKENWENAPEGARLEYIEGNEWLRCHLVGFLRDNKPVIQFSSAYFTWIAVSRLRIVLPKRKITVRLCKTPGGKLHALMPEEYLSNRWTIIGEHTFEIEGE